MPAMVAKRDTGRGLTDRKIIFAVGIGVVLGAVISLLQVRRGAGGGAAAAGLKPLSAFKVSQGKGSRCFGER